MRASLTNLRDKMAKMGTHFLAGTISCTHRNLLSCFALLDKLSRCWNSLFKLRKSSISRWEVDTIISRDLTLLTMKKIIFFFLLNFLNHYHFVLVSEGRVAVTSVSHHK